MRDESNETRDESKGKGTSYREKGEIFPSIPDCRAKYIEDRQKRVRFYTVPIRDWDTLRGLWGDASLYENHLQLIRAARAGDKEAFTHLVHAYKGHLFRTALAIVRDYGEAEDVVQEAFVKAFLSLTTLKDERAFPSWLSTIATRIALDAVRKRQTKVGSYNDDVANLDALTARTARTSNSDLRLDLFEAMSKLSPEHRAVIALRELQGFDYQEIANILDIPLGTVRSRLHTARMQLRNLLHGHVERR
jgi:RNA polymerase sigma-70 factor, ECF subfamily